MCTYGPSKTCTFRDSYKELSDFDTLLQVQIMNNAEYYKITPFQHSPGIYYDSIQELKFYDTTWKLVTYIHISYVAERIELIDSLSSKTNSFCNMNGSSNQLIFCDATEQILQQLVTEIKVEVQNLKDLINHNRVKRGWLNSVHTLFKHFPEH